MIFPLTLPCRQAAKHWTSGADNKQSRPRYKHEVEKSDVRSEMSVFIPKSNSHFIYPVTILRNTKFWDVKHGKTESYESFVSLPTRLVLSELKKQMWDLGLDSRIGLRVTLSHLHNATHWTSGLNTWQRQQENPEKLYWHKADRCHAWESDVRGEMFVFMPKSDSHCIFPFVILHNTNLRKTLSLLKNPRHLSCRRHSTWYEANQKQKWDLDLDSRIRFPLTLSYTHITMQPFEHLAWTLGRENTNPETSHDKVEFATLRSQMSEVRCLSSCRNQIPTVSLLSSFSVTPCYQTVVDTMKKKKLLQDAATTPCSRRKLEPEFQWHGQLANRLNIWQRIQITLPTLLTQGWSSPRCGFWCQRWDVGLHGRFRFPLCLSFRHFFTTPTFETFHTIENPKHLSCRRYSTWYEANQKQRWVLDLDSRIRFPLTPSYPHITMQPFAHLAWTPGRENKNPETSTDKVEFATLKVRCQRRDGLSSCRSQILTKIFPLAILCETKFRNLEPESEQSNVSVPIRLVRSGRRKPFVISRSLLWSHLLTATILKSKRKSTNHSFARLRERLTQCSLPECSPPSKY